MNYFMQHVSTPVTSKLGPQFLLDCYSPHFHHDIAQPICVHCASFFVWCKIFVKENSIFFSIKISGLIVLIPLSLLRKHNLKHCASRQQVL
jgi:hypothetical protein